MAKKNDKFEAQFRAAIQRALPPDAQERLDRLKLVGRGELKAPDEVPAGGGKQV
jgi:DNA-binding TFAR19-related protein (PDSD5 family)